MRLTILLGVYNAIEAMEGGDRRTFFTSPDGIQRLLIATALTTPGSLSNISIDGMMDIINLIMPGLLDGLEANLPAGTPDWIRERFVNMVEERLMGLIFGANGNIRIDFNNFLAFREIFNLDMVFILNKAGIAEPGQRRRA